MKNVINMIKIYVSGWAHTQAGLLLFSEKYLVLICAYCSISIKHIQLTNIKSQMIYHLLQK
jgi:hypothetical protein